MKYENFGFNHMIKDVDLADEHDEHMMNTWWTWWTWWTGIGVPVLHKTHLGETLLEAAYNQSWSPILRMLWAHPRPLGVIQALLMNSYGAYWWGLASQLEPQNDVVRKILVYYNIS